jgi:hypothetical protein
MNESISATWISLSWFHVKFRSNYNDLMLKNSGLVNAGIGSNLNRLGQMELDSSLIIQNKNVSN